MNNSPDHLTPEAKKKSNAKKPQKWNGIPCHMKEHHCNDFIIKIGGWGVGGGNRRLTLGTTGFLCLLEESLEKSVNKKGFVFLF